MALPARLLRELLKNLKAEKTRKIALDKRNAPRVGMREPIKAFPVRAEGAAGVAVTSWVRNLSGTGIGLLARQTLTVGSEFVIPFHRPEGEPLRVLYRVTQVVRVGGDLFGIGGKLVRVIGDGSAAGTQAKRLAS